MPEHQDIAMKALLTDVFTTCHASVVLPGARAVCRGLPFEDVQDLVQDAYLKAMGNRELLTFDSPHAVARWIVAVVEGEFRNHARKVMRRKSIVERNATALAGTPRDAHEDLEADESFFSLIDSLDGLPQRSRDAILLRAAGYGYPEIAAHLGASQKACRNLVSRANLRLVETRGEETSCEKHRDDLPRAVEGSRVPRRLGRHLSHCSSCQGTIRALRWQGHTLHGMVPPVVLVGESVSGGIGTQALEGAETIGASFGPRVVSGLTNAVMNVGQRAAEVVHGAGALTKLAGAGAAAVLAFAGIGALSQKEPRAVSDAVVSVQPAQTSRVKDEPRPVVKVSRERVKMMSRRPVRPAPPRSGRVRTTPPRPQRTPRRAVTPPAPSASAEAEFLPGPDNTGALVLP